MGSEAPEYNVTQDLLAISYIVSCLVVWFDTEALVEYAKLFRLEGLFDSKDYEDGRLKGKWSDYPEFLRISSPSFLTRLISCPICAGFWLSIFLGVIAGKWHFFAFYFVSSLILYLLIKKLFQ